MARASLQRAAIAVANRAGRVRWHVDHRACERDSCAVTSSEGKAGNSLIGTTIGEKYRVVRQLGAGGMGAVFEGEHTIIARRVAIKVLHGELATDASLVERFVREARAATAIGNEHIVEVTDMGRLPDGGPFMVLEYLEGQDFAHLVDREAPLPLARAVHVVRQMCDGLAAAHDKGIVHRDLKPENVFLVTRHHDRDFVKILDFGISKILDGRDAATSGTRTGTVVGTGYYMAPEQATGRKDLDHRADVWALGVILFRALTGEFPFEADTYTGLLVKVVTEPPRALRALRPDLPDEVIAIVARCMEKAPEARFADCRSLSRALAPFEHADRVDALGETGVGPTVAPRVPTDATPATAPLEVALRATRAARPEPTPSVPVPTPPPVSRPWVVWAFSLVLAVGVGLALVMSNRSPEHEPAARERPPPPSTGAAEVRPPPTRVEPTEPDPATPPLPHASVHVHLVTVPPDAALTLDGVPLPNPFDDDLPRGADMHVLEASANGYQSDRRDLSLLFPVDLTVTLTPGHGTTTHAATRAPSSATTAARTTTEGTAAPPSTVAPSTVATAPPPSTAVPATTTTPVPEGVVVPPEQRLLKHLGAHH
jgi:serine/threonine-protein kinase